MSPLHRRTLARLPAAAMLPILLLTLAAADPARLDPDATTRAIDRIRAVLPSSWSTTDIQWDTVPLGWTGDSAAVFLRLEDEGTRYPHPSGEFEYSPFYKLWILPLGWEGRMAVAALDPSVPYAMYFGENDDYRVLFRTLGRQSWDEGPDAIADALDLDAFPLTARPQHTLDIDAMQVLYRRLDTRPGALDHWQRAIWGIAGLPHLIYLELLTWDERGDSRDPTSLGDLAERETAYLARETMAAFPEARGLYLRRVTERSFSDVLLVNPARAMASAP